MTGVRTTVVKVPTQDSELASEQHVNSLAVLAEGFSLRSDVPLPPDGHATEMVAPVEGHAAGTAADTLEQISAWAKSTLRINHVPALWRVLARQPRFLAATWAKNCLVLTPAEVPGPAASGASGSLDVHCGRPD